MEKRGDWLPSLAAAFAREARFVGLAFAYGYGVEAVDGGVQWLWGFALVVPILHFWYDGFIWSVRKKQV
jgi:hypothetical protein